MQRLAAGGDHAQVRRGTEHVAHELRSRLEHVLAIVDEQQKPPLPQIGNQDVSRLHAGLVSEVQRCEHGIGHLGCISDLAKLDQPGSIREAPREFGPDTNGEPGLPHPARADQAHHARGRELLPDLAKLASAADKRRCLRRRLPVG